jgi:PII-like signaling protein
VNRDGLKLTSYFGERDRDDERFLADTLVDLYARHELSVSILMRGVEGFGLKHRLRTDRLLSLSEDLPVVSVAVDARERIERVLPVVQALPHPGLVTLERARLLTDDVRPARLPEELGEATKLTIYLGRQERVYGMPGFAAVCDLLYRRGVAGATVLLGVDGTARGVRQRARFFGRNAEIPLMIIAVGAGEPIARVLPELGGLLRRPLLTLERVRVCKRDGELLSCPEELPGTDEHGLAYAQKLMVYTSEQAHFDGEPMHLALIRRLRAAGVGGATCLRGIWGFHGDHAPHGDRFFQLRRHVPVLTVIVDLAERIGAAFAIVDEVTRERGLVTSEMVPAAMATTEQRRYGGLRLAGEPG